MLLNVWQTNFTSGELSEYLYARTDLKQYGNSARSIKNFIIRPQGGIFKRPGTVYVAGVKDSAALQRLIPFEYSTEQAYVLEMGAGYFRFFKDGGAILSTAAITNGTFTTDLTGWTDDDTGTGASTHSVDLMRLAGGAAGVAKRTQAVSNVGTSQYTLTFTVATNTCVYNIGTTSGGTDIATGTGTVGANSVNFTPTTAGTIYIQFTNSANNNSDVDTVVLSTPVYQVQNSFLSAELDAVQYAQSFDKLYLVHGLHAPVELTRTGHSAWTIADVELTDGPYFDVTDKVYGGKGSDIVITPSGTTSVVGNAVTLTAGSDLFVSTDVNRYFRYRQTDTSVWAWAKITGYTSPTVVTGIVKKAFPGNTAGKGWQLGSFSDTTGWPETITFHEQRIVFGKTTKQQQTVWFSTAGDIVNFQPDNDAYLGEVDADTAMTYTISDAKANVIRWMASQKILFIGTSGSLFAARASSTGEALTPDNIQINAVVAEPSSLYPPVLASNTVLYTQRFGRKLLEIKYAFEEDSYKTSDLAILAERRTKGKIKWLSRQNAPNYLLWGVTEDGKLFAITYIKDQNVLAWTEQVLGGTDVAVKAVATIPGSTEDETWFIVSRTVNGSTVKYIEYISPAYIEQEVTSSNFIDCSIAYSGGSTTALSGLTHLEGQTVQVFSTAGYQVTPTAAVTSGAITVSKAVTGAIVGLPYTASVTMNQFFLEGGFGSTSGKYGRIHKAVLRLYNSYGGSIGINSSTLDVMPEYGSSTIMDSSLTLFTGDREFQVPSDFSLNPLLYIEHSIPVPFNLLGVVMKASVSSK